MRYSVQKYKIICGISCPEGDIVQKVMIYEAENIEGVIKQLKDAKFDEKYDFVDIRKVEE